MQYVHYLSMQHADITLRLANPFPNSSQRHTFKAVGMTIASLHPIVLAKAKLVLFTEAMLHPMICSACRNNENLGRLSCKIVSPLVFAHVRAAYPGMPVSEQNCHPFQFSRYLWMHNGVIGGFMKIRRALLSTLADAAYDTVSSFHSDSAISFSIFLNHLPDLESQQAPQVLLQAMEVCCLFITMPITPRCPCLALQLSNLASLLCHCLLF